MIQDNQIHQDDIRNSLEISLNLQIMIQLNMFINKKKYVMFYLIQS